MIETKNKNIRNSDNNSRMYDETAFWFVTGKTTVSITDIICLCESFGPWFLASYKYQHVEFEHVT